MPKINNRFITVRVGEAGVQRIVIAHVCLCVCGYVTTITRNCVHRSTPNWVCKYR